MEYRELHKIVQRRINDLVYSANCSYRQLSLAIGKSENYIQKVISGHIMPTLPVIYDICEYFHISLYDFFNTDVDHVIEYNKVNRIIKKASAERLNALYTILTQK
jgi:transcriptional regulator with XRE-family HTH domain